jgi:ComF family protein
MQGTGDFLRLFFPLNCLVCGKRLNIPGMALCFDCEMNLPKSGLGDDEDNPVSRIFWGRIPVRAGTSLFKFEKGSAYQSLIHDLKYRGNQKLGCYLGRLLGQKLKKGVFMECDLLVPVPLHPRRQRQRGYNQSELISRGVSEITGIPVYTNLVRRKHYQHSQTTKSREERFENMEKAFSLCGSPPDLHDKNILLIDDIVTTGATLEACCSLLLKRFNCTVYVATVSYA